VDDPGMSDAHFNLSVLQARAGETQSAFRHLLAYHRLTDAHQNPTDWTTVKDDE
jgi:hypothetical protein